MSMGCAMNRPPVKTKRHSFARRLAPPPGPKESARLASFPERNPNPVLETDLAGRVRYLNPAARRLFPGLARQGPAHPWLAHWPALARALRRRGSKPISREIAVGKRWFHQTLIYVEADRRINIYGMDITGRRQAEEALREAALRYRTVADNTHDFEFWLSPEGRYLYASPGCKRIYGRAPAEFLANPRLRFNTVYKEDRPIFRRHIEAEVRRRMAGQIEFRIVRPDGALRWVGHVCRPVYDEQGRYLGVRGSNRDITARKQAELALRQVNERLDLAQDASGAGVWDWDLATRRLEWSPRMFDLLGLDPRHGAASFKAWRAAVHPADRKGAEERIARALRDKTFLNNEYRIVLPGGQIRWINALGQGRYDARGKPLRMLGLCLDITRLKELEKRTNELTASHAAAQSALAILDALPVGMVLLGRDGIISSVNPAFELMTGCPKGKFIGRPARDAIGGLAATADRPRLLELLRAAEQGRSAVSLACDLIDEKGATFSTIVDVAFLKDAGSRPSAIIMTFKDISELRRMENTLRRNEARLSEAQRIARIGNWDWNIADGELVWSDEIYRIFGRRQREFEVTYEAFLKAVHPADRALVQGAIDKAIRKEQAYSIEHRIVLPDGAERAVHGEGQVFRDAAGQAVRMAGTVQDITEHRNSERRDQMITTLLALFVRKSSRKEYLDAVTKVLQQASDCGCVGIRVADASGRIAYESQLGFPAPFVAAECELALSRDACVCARVAAGRPAPRDRECLTAGGSFRCDNLAEFAAGLSPKARKRFRGACFRAGFASLAVVPIRYHERLLGVIHLADKRQGKTPRELIDFIESIMASMIGEAISWFAMDQSLRQVGAYNRSLIEASLDPLVTIDAQGKITDVNAATEKVTGHSRQELIGADFADYFTDRARAQAGYQRVFRDGAVKDYALEIRRRDGRVTPVLYNATVYRDEQGKVVGVFAAARDITERREAQRAVEAYEAELRSLSMRMSLAEENARRQLATALHDTVGQNLALSKLKLGALGEMLGAGPAQEALAQVREILEDAASRTRSLYFELSPPILYELGLDAALEWLGEELQKRHGFRFHFESDGDTVALTEALKILLFQSARELLMNVVKHAGASRVDMASRRAGKRIEITVRDDGKGFSVRGGVGEAPAGNKSLGLFSIRERMRHIGGLFRIESAPGRGTTATVSVPAALKIIEAKPAGRGRPPVSRKPGGKQKEIES